jgi:acyl carrier protein
MTINLPVKLLNYLNETRAPLPPITDPDQPLKIDSLGLIRLVAFMESDLGMQIDDDDILADHFATARSLEKWLSAKSATASQSSDSPEQTANTSR